MPRPTRCARSPQHRRCRPADIRDPSNAPPNIKPDMPCIARVDHRVIANPCIGRAMHAIPFDASLTFVPIAHRHPPANWLPVCPCSPALTVAIESPCCCLSVPENPNFAVSDRQQSQDPRRHPIAHTPLGLCPADDPREPVSSGSLETSFQSTSFGRQELRTCRTPCQSNRSRCCRGASSPHSPYGDSTSPVPVHVFAATLNTASRDVA